MFEISLGRKFKQDNPLIEKEPTEAEPGEAGRFSGDSLKFLFEKAFQKKAFFFNKRRGKSLIKLPFFISFFFFKRLFFFCKKFFFFLIFLLRFLFLFFFKFF